MDLLRRAGVLALAASAVACFAPETRECAVTCSAAGACEDGLQCRADGFCHAPNDQTSCAMEIEPDAEHSLEEDAAPVDSFVPPPPDSLPVDAPDPVTVSLGEGVTTDTFVDDANNSANFGARDAIEVDNSPITTGLVRFDLSSIPTGSTVLDVHLTIWTNSLHLGNGLCYVYKVLEEWDEGSSTGSSGTANYDNRKSGTPWTTSGARAPGSRDATVLASFNPDVDDTAWTLTIPVSVVQGWVTDPTTNFGFALAADQSEVHFHSSESGDTGRRPFLEITYQPPY